MDSLDLPPLEVEIPIETVNLDFDPSEVLLNLLLQHIKARTSKNNTLTALELEELIYNTYEHYISLGYSLETVETYRKKIETTTKNVKIRKVDYIHPKGSKYIIKIEYITNNDKVEKVKIEKIKIENI